MRVYISKQYPAQNTTSKASLHIELTVIIKKEIYTDLSFISIIIMSIIPVSLKQCIRNRKFVYHAVINYQATAANRRE